MSSKALKVAFQNVQITVEKQTDSATGAVSYKVVSATPQPVVITEPDTILNYQLVAPTPDDVVFTGLTLTPANHQFSKPTISADGKNITLSDVNTQWGNFQRTFEFNGQPEAGGSVSKASVAALLPGDDIENRPPAPPPPPPAP
jgi:hypothetical protein